ncbi:MAG TPA: SCP2 sterol-binding domain-containing protein [Longimicrobium sp.]|jgi:putative sterol carrier protein|uniref:SCP2 sterol-binding domain-containing protein n=1 Tax=Longimicrobium sp. TaxID=2029185 RepID=UPI002ED9D55C
MEVFTEPWCVACCERMNESEAYGRAAATWEGTAVLVMTADPAHGIAEERAAWLDMHHGACRGTRLATDADRAGAAYVFQADPATWKRLLAGEVDPVASVMTGKLRLTRGSLFTLAKYAQAAREMVVAAGQAGGSFPPMAS